jgi:hypothetical protein
VGDKPLRNRFATTPPDFATMQARGHAKLVELHEKADACLAGWSAPDPALAKGVMLAIHIDATGLQAVTIEDQVDIPSGPLRCLSDAVYAIDWSGVTKQPVMATVRERYETADAGDSEEPR